jgi:hypothetical protein
LEAYRLEVLAFDLIELELTTAQNRLLQKIERYRTVPSYFNQSNRGRAVGGLEIRRPSDRNRGTQLCNYPGEQMKRTTADEGVESQHVQLGGVEEKNKDMM